MWSWKVDYYYFLSCAKWRVLKMIHTLRSQNAVRSLLMFRSDGIFVTSHRIYGYRCSIILCHMVFIAKYFLSASAKESNLCNMNLWIQMCLQVEFFAHVSHAFVYIYLVCELVNNSIVIYAIGFNQSGICKMSLQYHGFLFLWKV